MNIDTKKIQNIRQRIANKKFKAVDSGRKITQRSELKLSLVSNSGSLVKESNKTISQTVQEIRDFHIERTARKQRIKIAGRASTHFGKRGKQSLRDKVFGGTNDYSSTTNLRAKKLSRR